MNFTGLEEGFAIMCVGMSVVFGFLVVLILSMYGMASVIKVINKFFPEVVPEQKSSKPKRQGKDEEEVAIAIAVAIRSM